MSIRSAEGVHGGYTQPLSDTMLNSVYTLWSKVLSIDDFIAMVSPVKKATR